MSLTYDNKARSQEAHRRTQDPLDALAENTLGLINQAAAQASENIKTAFASAQRLSANLDAAQARIRELESVRAHYRSLALRSAPCWVSSRPDGTVRGGNQGRLAGRTRRDTQGATKSHSGSSMANGVRAKTK
jgi:hypothetical protein